MDDRYGPSRSTDGRPAEPAIERASSVVGRGGWAVLETRSVTGPRGWHTVGLATNHDHPELVVEAVSRAHGRAVLAAVAQAVAGGGTRLDHGDVVVAGGVDLRAVVMTDGLLPGDGPTHLHGAWVIEPRPMFDHGAVQLVWPDLGGRYPWDRGFSGDQPVLGPVPWVRPMP
jgi:hypothetical protein